MLCDYKDITDKLGELLDAARPDREEMKRRTQALRKRTAKDG